MTFLLCISDLSKHQEFKEIDRNNNVKTLPKKLLWDRVISLRANNQTTSTDKASNDNKQRILKRLYIEIDGINAFYLLRELQQLTQLRLQLNTNPAMRGIDIFWLQLRPPTKEVIDYKW